MRVAFLGSLTYAEEDVVHVQQSDSDSSMEVVHFYPNLTDTVRYSYTIQITDTNGSVSVRENFPQGVDGYNTYFGRLTGYSNGGAFTVAIQSESGTSGGVTSPPTSNSFEWVFTPSTVVTGSLTLYQDDRGGLFVPPGNPPIAVADSYTATQGTPLTVAAASAGLLANDTDPGGKPLTALLVGNPAHGAVTLRNNGTFTYTPAPGYSGSDSFTYQASDGALQSATTTVSLTVAPYKSNNGIVIISRAADGTQGNGASGGTGGSDGGYDNSNSFSISADGTKVAFNSDASNLVPGDTNGYTDVFVKDLTTGAIVLASTLTGSDVGRSLQPTLSPDGTKVAFATTPFVNRAPSGPAQIFIKDLITGTVTLAVTDSNGAKLVRDEFAYPVFSPDGKKLAFFSTADLTGAGTGKAGGLYIKDLGSRVATLVSANAAGKAGNGRSSEPVFSPDGTKIAFVSLSTNLGQIPKLGMSSDVYVKDLVTGAVTLVSADASGQRQGTVYNPLVDSTNPAFSPDGSKVAFQSTANNLVPGDQDNGSDVFIKDLATGAITRVTALADGTSEGGYGPAFSPDGTKIAFWTFATGYSPFPHPGGSSIYIKDLVTGAFTLLSAPANPANQGIGNNQDPRFSPDGREILFWGSNEALDPTDANGNTADIFLKTLSSMPLTPPTAVADSYTTAQGTKLSIAASAGLLANDTDPAGKPLTAQLVGNPAHGALTLNSDGSFTYTPAMGYSGSDAFTYKASDGAAQSTAATVALTVTAVNHPVTATDDSYAVSNAFPSADFTTTAAAGVLANDTAPDGGLVVLGIVVGGAVQTGFVRTAAGGSVNLATDGRLVYDQPFSSDDQGVIRYNGIDSFTYRVRDADGSTSDATVTLTVGSGVNHPVFANDDSYSVSTALLGTDFTTDIITGVLANDYAPDSGLVALGIVVNGVVQTGSTRTAAGGTANVLADGRLVYDQPFSTDAQGFIRYIGIDSFTYRVRDADGSTADAIVTLTVGGGVNHPVFATDDSYSVSTALLGTDFATDIATGVLANDYAPDGGLVALGIVVNGVVQTGSTRTAAGGTANVLADGRLVYDQPFSTDAQGFIRYIGIDSFTYRVRDSDGSTADATVTLTVGGGVNHPVFATDDSYSVSNAFPSADFSTDITTGVLANDFAPDDGLVALGIVVNGVVQTGFVRTAAGGQANVASDGRLTYDQPFSVNDQGPVRYTGVDSFVYRVRDADGSTADATVTLNVGNGVNHPVIATDDSYTVSNFLPAPYFTTSVASGLLANDTAADGGLVALGAVVNGVVQTGSVRTAAGGSVDVLPNGTFYYYRPYRADDQGVILYNGVDSFTYRVRDADGSTADATVTLNVGDGVNHPVTASDDSYTVPNSLPAPYFTTSVATGLLANDTAPDGGLVALGAVVNGAVQNGSARTAAGGSVDVLPNGTFYYYQPYRADDQGIIHYNGVDSFTYRVRDADGSTADATVTFNVGEGVNHPVTATDDSYTVPNSLPAPYFTTSVATGLLANDTAPDGGLVALGAVVNGVVQTGSARTTAGGSVDLLPNGTFYYYQPYSADDQGVIPFNGLDSFTYRVRDADGSTADATVTLTVGTPPAPVEATIGDGPDDLALYISEDAYRGDAQYAVSVDGQQIGGVQTATAAHGAGQPQLLNVKGTFGATPHTATVDFLNDAYGGSSTTDRNLYVDHATINGATIGDSTLTLFSGGPQSFHFGGPAGPTTIGIGSDMLDLLLAEDAYLGDAQLTVSVDGRQIGGQLSASASHAAGQDQTLHVLGTFGAGHHTVSVNFLNDAYGGAATTDRNLYVDGATINGATIGDSALALFSGGPQSFHFGGPAGPTTIGVGSDTLDLLLSEDAYLGDAQLTVSVDGSQIGGLLIASASHAMGQDQVVHVLGTFSAGPHTVSVDFLNDAYDGSPTTDRNLYVDGATINGAAVASSNLALYAGGLQSFTFTEQHVGLPVMPV